MLGKWHGLEETVRWPEQEQKKGELDFEGRCGLR